MCVIEMTQRLLYMFLPFEKKKSSTRTICKSPHCSGDLYVIRYDCIIVYKVNR